MVTLRILKVIELYQPRQVSEDDEITVYLKDGSIRSKVIEVGGSMAKKLEQSFERLEEIIAQMEKSDTTLDASFKMYQEG